MNWITGPIQLTILIIVIGQSTILYVVIIVTYIYCFLKSMRMYLKNDISLSLYN